MIVFSISILVFLWVFQILFLNTYYEWRKEGEVKNTAKLVVSNYQETGTSSLEQLAFQKNVCIELMENNKVFYSSETFNKGCMMGNNTFKQEFIKEGYSEKGYQFENPKFHNKTLVYAIKVSDNICAFISASLVPVQSTTQILADQFIIVTFFVLALGFLISYFISKRLSKPIEELTTSAKKVAKGNYEVNFEASGNIEELNELADTLNYAKDELSKTDEIRKELLANVSHDLKTPLTMIQAYAEMAHDLNKDKEEKRNQNLEVIMEETKRLNLLVNDILELSKLESKAIPLKLEKIHINELIKTIFKRYQYLEETENYHFILEATKEYVVKADIKRIEQVLYNLVNNAINYVGEDKTVIIQLTEKKHHILVEVIDHGKGISKEDLKLIWDRYYKIDKKYQRSHYGTGLGLSIVKNILIAHNVEYGVTSKKGKGTTFYFELEKN